MADSSSKPIPIQEGLRLMGQCPLCKKTRPPEAADVLAEKKGAHLVHIKCPFCHNAVLAVIAVTGVGLSSVGMVTDLSPDDVLRLKSDDPVSEEELLAFHSLIKQNKIDFII